MLRRVSQVCMFLFIIAFFSEAKGLVKETKRFKSMGSDFSITVVAQNTEQALDAINKGIAEINRIEKLISSWDENSDTYRVIKNAGNSPVVVNHELYGLITRSLKVSELTNGAFDISFAVSGDLWIFDKKEHHLPDSSAIQKSTALINWQLIILNEINKSILLKKKGMRIGFGAIGKGFAANKALQKIKTTEGITGCIVNASGDLAVWGTNEQDQAWQIKILNPSGKNKALGWLNSSNIAVVTSGNYEKFFTNNGKRYAHIIDPRTGYPAQGLLSVTIICPDAELADALATAVFVLGKDEGLALVNKLKNIDCLMVTDDNEILTSNNLQLNYYE